MALNKISESYMIAIRASIEASVAIEEIYNSGFNVNYKEDGSPITEADLKSSGIIFEALNETGIPITGEELTPVGYNVRSEWKESWCVDPLDGTRMFLKKNGEFCVSIAHIVDSKPVFGIISSPIKKEVLIGGHGIGAFVFSFNDINSREKWIELTPKKEPNKPIVITCSRGFMESNYVLLEELKSVYGELEYLHLGSAMKFFELAKGNADYYLRFAPTMEWDIAAGQAIIETLGGTITSVQSGSPLTYNKESLYNPNFIVKTKPVIDK